MESKSVWPTVLVVLILLLGVLNYGFYASLKNKAAEKVDLSATNNAILGLEGKVSELSSKVEDLSAPSNESVLDENGKVSEMYNKLFRHDNEKEMSLNLAVEELDKKDFKQNMFDLLELNSSIESYKDITSIVVKDSDVSLSGDEAEVSLDLKVYYFIDGDKEEDMKAYVNAVCSVVNIEKDDNYEDMEVESCDLELVKVY